MSENRKIGIYTGILFIIGTLSGILSVVLTGPMNQSNNHYTLGALCVLIMGFSLAFIPIILYPLLKKHNKTFALGYVVFRGAIETFTYILVFICLVLLYESNGSENFILKIRELSNVSGTYVFSIGAIMLYYVLYKSVLLPRWLTIWGMIAIILHLITGILITFGIQTAMSPINLVMNFPIFLQEMVMAVWLIVKGFNREI